MIGSDGVWDVMNSAEVVGFIYERMEKVGMRERVTEDLVIECRHRWSLINDYKEKLFNEKNQNNNTAGARNNQILRQNIDHITTIICFININNL